MRRMASKQEKWLKIVENLKKFTLQLTAKATTALSTNLADYKNKLLKIKIRDWLIKQPSHYLNVSTKQIHV